MRFLLGAALIAGCGGPENPGPDPGPPDPLFDDGDARVVISEGVWPGVGQPWAGVSAWFSDTPSQLSESARIGACRLLVSDTMYCEGCEDGWCVGGVCRPSPAGRSAGAITIDGLIDPMTLTWVDSYYSQSWQPTGDVFAAGAAIAVTATGDEVAAFTAGVRGVDAIEPDLGGACANALHLTRGEDFAVTWADPVEGARVHLRLPSPNNGHGMPPRAVIECDGPDTGGFTVPAALIDGLPDLNETDPCDGTGCVGNDCPPSSVARYSRATAAAGSETVVVRAEAEVNFYLFDD